MAREAAASARVVAAETGMRRPSSAATALRGRPTRFFAAAVLPVDFALALAVFGGRPTRFLAVVFAEAFRVDLVVAFFAAFAVCDFGGRPARRFLRPLVGVAFAAVPLLSLFGGLPRRFFGVGVSPVGLALAEVDFAFDFARAILRAPRDAGMELQKSYFIPAMCAHQLALVSSSTGRRRTRLISRSISTTMAVPSMAENSISPDAARSR